MRRQSHHWDRSPCLFRMRGQLRLDLEVVLPEPIALIPFGDRGGRFELPTVHLDRRRRVGLEIVEPRWVSGGAAGRTGDDVVGTVL